MPKNYTVGAELEFYLLDKNNNIIADINSGKFPQKHFDILPEFADSVQAFCAELADFSIKTESGPGQFEVEFPPYQNQAGLVELINKFKVISHKIAASLELNISFIPKPFELYCGSALHIHFCHELFDPYGLIRNNGVMQQKLDPNNEYVLWAIGGCLARIKQDINIFIPTEESKKRLVGFMNAPTKICWGRNNRSVAVRVPDSRPKRIEHRVAGADADAQKVISAVIEAAFYGMENKISPNEEIYGNAWEDKYDREPIITS